VLSIYLAQSGYDTLVFDRSADYRKLNEVSDRSINLTLCERGLQALERIGVADEVLEISVPGRGRVMHGLDGATCFQPYGNNQEAIYSVSRNHPAEATVTPVRCNFSLHISRSSSRGSFEQP
jgi:kynurenine 3-monooxygenase